ncbi:ribbon-helix-helix protein, CopG family [Suttonella indologenes]|uniref:Uncharacterized protein n=1 Tax=Suttonella indologenes TaxID=13276 RepID=A0A380N235_9GAMM|nr:ribbon-helix-helix protein, CopG family [Suttonella indologenes]SUO91923.1 Uncharacterised protein [Suttonella indologenes]SUO98544.1 Uncharacterised protein [Suttonella indologenes]
MAKTRNQIQAESDARRDVKLKAFKLPIAVVEEFERIATEQGLANNALFIAALEAYKKQENIA